MDYSIENFWENRISTESIGEMSLEKVKGWSRATSLETFVEAPMSLKSDCGDADPQVSSIILVSVPGAVGKTTLAREIAAVTGAILVDLAEADAVGAFTLTGSFIESNLYESFKCGKTAVIIDGLDEARMDVTLESMTAFMKNLVALASDNRNPIILLGRTGAVDVAWILLNDEDVQVPVLQIDRYDRKKAEDFVRLWIQHFRGEQHPREPDKRAVKLMLDRLEDLTPKDGGTFSGYSPVLMALAEIIADRNTNSSDNVNIQKLISRIEKGEEVFSLEGIAKTIMEREQSKLSKIQFEDKKLTNILYSPEEQLDRLAARIYGGALDYSLPAMSHVDEQKYNKALESWFEEHPFLDGEGRNHSSPVFAGLLAAHALKRPQSKEVALKTELGRNERNAPVNPFLAEFYISLPKDDQTLPHMPSEHFGIMHASIQARLAIGEYASLVIDADDESGQAEIEIVRGGGPSMAPKLLRFKIDSAGHIVFGPQIKDVNVSAPQSMVSVGFSSENDAVLVAPVYIEAKSLVIEAKQMVVERPSKAAKHVHDQMNVVQLLADETASDISKRAIRRDNVSLKVSWPSAESFPWTDYAFSIYDKKYDSRTEEALRRLRKILRLFRSHGKNQLAKFRDAIDHHRRTQGVGSLVLEQLIKKMFSRALIVCTFWTLRVLMRLQDLSWKIFAQAGYIRRRQSILLKRHLQTTDCLLQFNFRRQVGELLVIV